MTRLIARLLLAATRWLIGAEIGGPADPQAGRPTIYFARHASHLDTLAIMASLPDSQREGVHPVAARDYWGATPLRRFVAVHCLNAALIDRAAGPGGDALSVVADLLASGRSVILFPEGTRGQGGIGKFKSGLFHLAQRFPEADLIPVQLDNVHRVLPKGSHLPVPLRCGVSFGVRLQRLDGETKEGFLARARTAVTWPRGVSQTGPVATP